MNEKQQPLFDTVDRRILAVLFAALSRGAGRIRGRAAAGLWTGIAGLVLGTLMTVLWMVMLAGGAA